MKINRLSIYMIGIWSPTQITTIQSHCQIISSHNCTKRWEFRQNLNLGICIHLHSILRAQYEQNENSPLDLCYCTKLKPPHIQILISFHDVRSVMFKQTATMNRLFVRSTCGEVINQ